jgi:P27 family predicted phage terminase small subunit
MPKAPLPKQLKQLKGTYQANKELSNQMEAAPLSTIPMAPESLPLIAQQEWYKVTAELEQLKVLSVLDMKMLEAYCYQIALVEEARHMLETEGKTIIMHNKGGGMYPVKSPWITIHNEALSLALKLAQQFGLTPSARTRISMGQVKEEKKNPFDGF